VGDRLALPFPTLLEDWTMRVSHRFLLLLATLVVVVPLLIVVAYTDIKSWQGSLERSKSLATLESAKQNLRIGMTRDEARRQLETAWRYYLCRGSVSSEEVYIFGSRNTELASILHLRFDNEGSQWVLTRISSLEYYQLESYRRTCEMYEK
jgi:hypothetical protein